MNDNCWWDVATDEERRHLARSAVEMAKALRAHVDNSQNGMEALQICVSALEQEFKNHPVVTECRRGLAKLLSIEMPPFDFDDMLAMIGSAKPER